MLSRLNDVLVSDMLDDHFMTMFAGVLDLRTKRLRYAMAGHERPLLLRGGANEFLRLESRGMPLGIHAGIEYPEGEAVLLRAGDLVVFLTDGLWEATNGVGEEFGYGRLEAALRTTRAGTASEIIAAVKEEVFGFIGETRQVDDVTLMVLKIS